MENIILLKVMVLNINWNNGMQIRFFENKVLPIGEVFQDKAR